MRRDWGWGGAGTVSVERRDGSARERVSCAGGT